MNIYLTFFASLAVYPAIQSQIKSLNELGFLGIYFQGVTVFLTFNVFAMLGNILATDRFPKPGPKYLWIPVVLRLVFIPFFMFCNYKPEARKWDVLITSDTAYLFAGILLGLTSGYLSSLSMMYAPKIVKRPEDAETAGMMAGFFLIFGIFSGVSSSFLWSYIILTKF